MTSYWNKEPDPYRYAGSTVLKNVPGLRNAELLEAFEQRAAALRIAELPDAIPHLPVTLAMWQVIHRVLFQDVYGWAGELRTIGIAKGGTVFAMPPFIVGEADRLFGCLAAEQIAALDRERLADRLGYYFGEINMLHPFREGNGRTQKLLFDEIARRVAYRIDWNQMGIDELLQAVIAAYGENDHSLLTSLFNRSLAKA